MQWPREPLSPVLEIPIPTSGHLPYGTFAESLQQGYHLAGEPYAGPRGLETLLQAPAAAQEVVNGIQVRTSCSSPRPQKP